MFRGISNSKLRGPTTKAKIEHVLCAISKLSTLFENDIIILKQIVSETQKILVGQAVLQMLIKTGETWF